jgi:hypothetical protein
LGVPYRILVVKCLEKWSISTPTCKEEDTKAGQEIVNWIDADYNL